MDFVFTEEQEQLRSQARSFLADHSSSEQVRQAMAGELGYDPEVWKRISSELGWPSVIVPEAYGGLGLGHVELVALMEVMGEALLCAPFFSSVGLAAQALLEAGNEEQKRSQLPRIAEGQTLAALAWTGPRGDWSAGGTEIAARSDGSGFVLSGCARHVLDGHCADLLVVAARREGSHGEQGVSLFVLPAETAGITRRLLATMDQTRRLAEIRFDAVRLPATSLMGEEGGAGRALARTLDLAAVALAAEQVGGAQRCLDLSVAYAAEREQFGRPIGSFQAIKHKCADMMVAVESARTAAYYAGCVAAEGLPELASAASLAKATCSDAYFRCAADALQIHGGVGFTWEYDVHLYLKRARSTEIFLGSPAFHRERVAGIVLGDGSGT
jgi:alkylation response protein AidB-like acyl-CoA dehydrogenase